MGWSTSSNSITSYDSPRDSLSFHAKEAGLWIEKRDELQRESRVRVKGVCYDHRSIQLFFLLFFQHRFFSETVKVVCVIFLSSLDITFFSFSQHEFTLGRMTSESTQVSLSLPLDQRDSESWGSIKERVIIHQTVWSLFSLNLFRHHRHWIAVTSIQL